MGNNKCTNTKVQLKNKSVQHRQKKLNKATQCIDNNDEDLDIFDHFMIVIIFVVYLAMLSFALWLIK